ncbi:hypothetical protein SSX86_008120 [Deinandra increscens subsp. villosa]|uniref:Transposase n=1 Tax=Deinandra increscens subsp. villosa TaxID=3103831 RepID=A0AAP0DBZ7_9ASTR
MDHEAGETLKDLNYNSERKYNDDSSQASEEDEMDNNDDHYSLQSEEDEMDNNDAHVDNDAQLDNDAQVTENEEATTSAPQANKRGLTRLAKWHAKFENNGGEKWPLTFDALGRIGGEHNPKFSSFMGDIARSEVGLRGPIMVRLGGLLRSFRRKMFEKHIRPNLAKPTVLEKVPKMYRAIVKKEDWDKFVAYTKSDEFKAVSKSAKEVRAQYVYDHTMGRGGYVYLREKLVQNKEIAADDCPSRVFMWRKGRVNKEGEYKTPVVKGIADDIAENETKINAGSVTVEPGTDALTLGAPKGRSKERIEKLEAELKNEKHRREKKDQELEHLTDMVKAQHDKIDKLTAFMNLMIQDKQVDKAVNSVKSAEKPLTTTRRSKNSCNQHSNVNTTDMINSAHNTSRKQSIPSNSSQRSADKVRI